MKNRSSRNGSVLVIVLAIVLGVFAVVGIWYYFEIILPSHYEQKPVSQLTKIVSSTTSVDAITTNMTSTASTTFFGGYLKVATSTSDSLTLLLSPQELGPFSSGKSTITVMGYFTYSTSTVSIIGVIESSTTPLTSALVDPRFTTGLSGDSYFKIHILQSWFSETNHFPPGILNGQQMEVVASNAYLNDFKILSGDVIMIQLAGCALYDGWPSFNCTNNIVFPQQWIVSPDNLFVSWQGQNGANLSLAGASLDTFASNSVLSFQVAATSGYGEFCPNSLLQTGPTLLKDEDGFSWHPTAAFPSICTGPNVTSSASTFLPFPTTTSTVLTVNVLGQDGTSQTFFNLYPLPDGQLFLVNASTSDTSGQ